jgi:hypothetical protein
VARAQCNDAYWHGVFGGLYLPHLRAAIWHELAAAEALLRAAEPLRAEALDFDCDGHAELWIHGPAFSALVSPHRGATVEEYSGLAARCNSADVLTRRREPYHEAGAPPPTDPGPRALFVDGLLGPDLTVDHLIRGTGAPLASWGGTPFHHELAADGDAVSIRCAPCDEGALRAKHLRLSADGTIRVEYRWDPAGLPEGAWFATELSLTRALRIDSDPPAQVWEYPITTMAKSERGFDETRQGVAHVLRWPARVAQATVVLHLEEARATGS